MIPRMLPAPKNSFFLFGPRGSGKSTWLKQHFSSDQALWIDLLKSKEEFRYSQNPDLLLEHWLGLKKRPAWIIIDEVQKIPKLLDIVHRGIEEHKIKFALTGSSARKLKHGAANLLAGRAYNLRLLPFHHLELGRRFNLRESLSWGSLPRLYSAELQEAKEKERYLYSYISTYLKEEILVEQVVRKIEPFRRFLGVAAQSNGDILNFSSIGRDAGIDPKAVERYYQILEETLLGYFIEPFHLSVRKRQSKHSKFYFFDVGIPRALRSELENPITEANYNYGKLFEHFIILEIIKLNEALERRCQFSYLRTKDDQEIDLIVEQSGGRRVLIEIKSSTQVKDETILKLAKLGKDIPHSKMLILSRAKEARFSNGVYCLPWEEGIKEIFDLV